MTPQAFLLSPSDEDDDLDDDFEEDEDEEVEQDEEDDEDEETWQVSPDQGARSSAVRLTSGAQLPTLAPLYGRRASRTAGPRWLHSAPLM